jgi:glycosyltransferase involved in cell wall biosynthesis
MDKLKIAIVVQRYGEEVNGGAEQMARWLAEHLLSLADVDVISTCAIDYNTWEDAYPSGESELNGVHIHRFAVDSPRTADMGARTLALRYQEHTLFEEFEWVRDQGPYSSAMLKFIRESYERYNIFIFVTYLYATAFYGLPLVSDKAILIPTAHEEWYLELPAYRALFHLPELIVYLTEPEMSHVHRVTGNEQVPGVIVGVGINTPDDVSADHFREQYGLDGEFLIYVGRIDEAKNVPELLDFFARFQEDYGRDLKLVLLGKAQFPLPQRSDIIPLGFVSEQDKFDALRAATLLVVPSMYESLSMVVLEAWKMGTPVLVNGRCAVLKHQCRQSNGGLYYHTYDEFALTLQTLLENPAIRDDMGHQGSMFANSIYDWEIIIAKYRAIFETLSGR